MAPKKRVTKMKQADLLFCQHILQEFNRPKHNRYVPSFKQPVDATQVPSYRTVIKKPMDLSTIATKLENHEYSSAAAFRADFKLMFANSEEFNAGSPPSSVLQSGRMFSESFDEEWMKQSIWLRKNHPELVQDRRDDEEEEAPNGPPTKKLRQSSRLSASESSPTGQSPYTSVRAFTMQDASNSSTPVPTTSKKGTNKTSSFKATISKPVSSHHLIQATSSPDAASQTSNMNSRTSLQNTLRTMVEAEARAMLEDPNIKRPSEDNVLANTMWQAMMEEGNEEEGKASIDAWVEVAVNQIAKMSFMDIGDNIQAETRKALVVVMERHYQYLSSKLSNQCEALKARFEQ